MVALLLASSFPLLAQVPARNSDELFKLVITESELQETLKSSSWHFVVRAEFSEVPANSIVAGAVYVKGSGEFAPSFLDALYQFRTSAQAESFFDQPVPVISTERGGKELSKEEPDGQLPASGEDLDNLIAAGAEEARLVKVRMGVRDTEIEDEQQLVLDLRVGNTVVRFRYRLCIPQPPLADGQAPAQCSLESIARKELLKAGLKQLEIVLKGR
jgi:hypothetical protein